MWKSQTQSHSPPRASSAYTNADNEAPKKRFGASRRPHSLSPGPGGKSKSPTGIERRCQSLSSNVPTKISNDPGQEGLDQQTMQMLSAADDKEVTLPQCVLTKITRVLATKKREFMKLRKNFIVQQNSFIENYSQLRELENRAGSCDDALGDVQIVSVTGWTPHDLLLLVQDNIELQTDANHPHTLCKNVLQQLTLELGSIPEDVNILTDELYLRRMEVLNLLKCKVRPERNPYTNTMEWKTKLSELDLESENLQTTLKETVEAILNKIKSALELTKVPFLDRDLIIKKLERAQKENLILQTKVEDIAKKEPSPDTSSQPPEGAHCEGLSEALQKERSAREVLKGMVATAESMLRVARARIATLERQLKEARVEVETVKKKFKELDLLYRHRETSYDARSKKLLEASKTGEITIESLSRQRDALEIRVKELREQAEEVERTAAAREADARARLESLQAKVADQARVEHGARRGYARVSFQEKHKMASENHAAELEAKVKHLEEELANLRERSSRLIDVDRNRCLEFLPTKEPEPSDRETEIWKELQVTRMALARVEEELRQNRADKDSFLNSLARIAQGEDGNTLQEKIATDLLDKEHKIFKLQGTVEEYRENEKIMEQSMTQYENQLAALRMEVKRLQNYEVGTKEVPQQELQTELMDLHIKVETLTQERSALLNAAASRALMLERHERSADLFASVLKARRELAAYLDGTATPPSLDDCSRAEVSRSLTSMCVSAADTWSALRAERARVLRLESAVLAQSAALQREGQARTQLERRRALLEREVLRAERAAHFRDTPLANYPS